MTSSAVPTDRSADSAKTGGSAHPNPSMRMPASAGPTAKPTALAAPNSAMVVPSRMPRRHVADAGQHDPGVAELESDEEHRERHLPGLAGERDGGEHDRLDQGAPDDDHLAAVLVGPRAPERDEGHADDEDQGAEDADERGPLAVRDAHLAQVRRQQREDLADAETLDHRGDPEDRDEDAPVLAVTGSGWGKSRSAGRATRRA